MGLVMVDAEKGNPESVGHGLGGGIAGQESCG
jgi:hypothetical protein